MRRRRRLIPKGLVGMEELLAQMAIDMMHGDDRLFNAIRARRVKFYYLKGKKKVFV